MLTDFRNRKSQTENCNMTGGGVRQFGAKYITGGNPVW